MNGEQEASERPVASLRVGGVESHGAGVGGLHGRENGRGACPEENEMGKPNERCRWGKDVLPRQQARGKGLPQPQELTSN